MAGDDCSAARRMKPCGAVLKCNAGTCYCIDGEVFELPVEHTPINRTLTKGLGNTSSPPPW